MVALSAVRKSQVADYIIGSHFDGGRLIAFDNLEHYLLKELFGELFELSHPGLSQAVVVNEHVHNLWRNVVLLGLKAHITHRLAQYVPAVYLLLLCVGVGAEMDLNQPILKGLRHAGDIVGRTHE